MPEPRSLRVGGEGGVALYGEDAGEGVPVILLHGLTATRRYVVMGSRSLERSGHRVIAYDARGHGRSSPAPERAYDYACLASDLEAVMDAQGVARAVLAGVSMGAHTILRFALAHPERAAALAIITPGYDPEGGRGEGELAVWDVLARALRERGIDGFVAAYELERLPERLRAGAATALRQRLDAHEHLEAVADALEVVPRSRPFEELSQLAQIAVPSAVIASRDEADPGHPLALAERYAAAIPRAELLVEPHGHSPLAWQGGRVSRVIAALAARSGHPGAGADTTVSST